MMNVGKTISKTRALIAGAVATLAFMGAQPAAAWGRYGHDLVADLAYQRLNPAARAQVDQLLSYAPQQGVPKCPVNSLHKAAEWADCMRANDPVLEKQMHLHHTDRIPICGPAIPAQFCKDGRCAAGDIDREAAILADRRANPVDRLHALEAVIHLVGDEHQPVHASPVDESRGNPVTYPGQKKPNDNVHGLWDGALVNFAVPRGPGGISQLNDEIQRAGGGAAWTRGTPMDWALEANALARRNAFGALPQPVGCQAEGAQGTQALGMAYMQQAAPVVRLQIERAGVRLAYLLNRILS